ncbi:hypothetical protein Scep_029641 [Stephania cephalantha]|uniref:Uncharacterized protein n=1 Tax=Stephania cephalantha TaxID=152367 RepID=A0AAP0DY27_9MAGN
MSVPQRNSTNGQVTLVRKTKFERPAVPRCSSVHVNVVWGHSFVEQDDANEFLLKDHVSEPGDDDEAFLGKILYSASFENLAKSHIQYDTIIWVFVSLLMFLAWGVGVLMLLYLPVRRYILQRDTSSRSSDLSRTVLQDVGVPPSDSGSRRDRKVA